MAVCMFSVVSMQMLYSFLLVLVIGLVYPRASSFVPLLVAVSLFCVVLVVAVPFTISLFGGLCS